MGRGMGMGTGMREKERNGQLYNPQPGETSPRVLLM
jgi:hypothetical protein